MNLVEVVEKAHFDTKKIESMPKFRAGDVIAVHARITEGEKSRIQMFQGTVIAIKDFGGMNGHFRVRKMSSGIGVERVFPFHSPNVEKVDLITKGKTRRSKLYYLRERSGKSARIAASYDSKR